MEEGKLQIIAAMLVEDSELFQDIFMSTTEELDEFVKLDVYKFADDAELKWKEYIAESTLSKPDVVFVDVNLQGSTYNGLDFIQKVNYEWGNEVIIGVISTSEDEAEMAIAKKRGAMFWLKKSSDIDIVLPKFMKDFQKFKNREIAWKVYG